ncbi:MAG TPA: DUF4349 domain-containing protein [Thermoanaerobaculia bacterium]|nr:DUF4349 domain-containing protein [Thermoanaerobaculia bacterium]
MARSSLLASTLPIVALLLACGAEKSALPPGAAQEAVYAEPRSRSSALAPEMAGAVGEKISVVDDSATAAAPIERKLIRTGSAGLEVRAVPEAVAQVKSWVEEAGGYVGDESESEDGYGVKTAYITCRIPAEQLDALVERLKGLGKVERVQLSAQDITEQYFDLEIRLANQRRLETRLLELLERRTNELSDLLEIEREAARVRGEIEQLEGRKRFWDNQVSLSTLQVELHEPRPAIAGSEGGAWRTLLDSFRRFADNFVLSIAGIIAVAGGLIPVAVTLGLVIWIAVGLLRRRRRARRPEEPPAQG